MEATYLLGATIIREKRRTRKVCPLNLEEAENIEATGIIRPNKLEALVDQLEVTKKRGTH